MKSTKIKVQKMEVLAVIISVIGMAVACGSEAKEEVISTEMTVVQEEASTEETETLVVENESVAEETEALPEGTENQTEEVETAASEGHALAELVALLGMQDEECADFFGGGEENWTEDGGFYIGRIYEVPFYGETFPVFTSCDNDKIVNAVSVWLADGEKVVTQEEAQQWVDRITSYAEVEPTYHDAAESEAGSKSWKWFFNEICVSLYWTGDNLLSISMNPMMGELK